MADLVTSAGIGGNTAALTSANPSPEPSGSNRYMLGVACGFVSDPTAFKYGGSGGTNLGQIDSDVTIAGVYTANVWEVAPGPSGTTSAYADFSGTTENSISAVFYDNVDQGDPRGALQTATGDNGGFAASVDAEITVTGTTSGQEVAVAVAATAQGGATFVSLTADEETTFVVRSDTDPTPSGENHEVTGWIRGVASGSSLVLNATITFSSTFSTITWWLGALPLNSAAGGALVFNPLSGRGGAAAQPLAG